MNRHPEPNHDDFTNPWDHPTGMQPVYQDGYQPSPNTRRDTRTGLTVGIIIGAVVILLIGAGAVWAFTRSDDSAAGAEASNVETVIETVHAPEPEAAGTAPAASARSANPEMPAEVAVTPQTLGAANFDNAQPGSNATSHAFAEQVRVAYHNHYLRTGELNTTVQAYSPVTGKTYTMSCRDNGTYFTCAGGNNAVVNIS